MTNEELMREALEILLFRATQHEGFAAPEANYRAIESATSALAKSRLNTDDAVDEEVVATLDEALSTLRSVSYSDHPLKRGENYGRRKARIDRLLARIDAALSAMRKKS